MKIVKTAASTSIKLSRSEWERIGKTAGWSRSQEEIEKLNLSKEEAIKFAKEIKKKLESLGYKVPKVDIQDKVIIKTVKDGEGNTHNLDIELKPWANKNNKSYELRGGVRIMAGPYAHKRFKRKRFSPKNIETMLDFLKGTIKYTNDMQSLRGRRSENAEVARSQKYEATMSQLNNDNTATS
jgi:hypothetical protein